MDLHIDLHDAPPHLSEQIYRGLVDAVVDRRIVSGERLPSSRVLAEQLGVARTTVVYAYERLTAEGFFTSRVGSGTFVGDSGVRGSPAEPVTAAAGEMAARRWTGLDATRPDDPTGPPPRYDFRTGTPDPSLFPLERWRRTMAGQLRTVPAAAARYGEPAGVPELRQAITRHVALARAVACESDQVLVTRGAQQAFDLIARTLVEPGTRVAVEEPGYPPMRRVLQLVGAEVVPVPVDDHGIDVAAIPSDARLVYVTPSHQFPLGTVMSLSRRTQLLAWADDHDAIIVEDDYDTEFRFHDRPLAPLQQLDRSGRVIYVGTFSKTLLPSLRLGFCVAPRDLVGPLRVVKWLADGYTDPVIQHTLASFLQEGDFARHVRRARRTYAKRREHILDALEGALSPWLTPVPSVAGLHVCATIRSDARTDLAAVVGEARERGIAVELLDDYCYDPAGARPGLLLGYGGIDVDAIPAGLAVLGACLAGAA